MTTVEIKEIKPDIPIINDTKDTPENIKNLVGKDNGLTNENEVIGDSLEKDKVVIKVSTPDKLVDTVKVSIYEKVVFSITFVLRHVTVPYIKTVMKISLLYDWRESCLLIGPICLHKSLCLPENWSKLAQKVI